jgi:hypothetical protein
MRCKIINIDGIFSCVPVVVLKHCAGLPPFFFQICEILPGQSKLGRLSQQQTSALIRKTAIPAYERKREIENQLGGIISAAGPMLSRLGLTIEARMPKVPGRVLNPPALTFANNSSVTPDNGKWDMRSKRFYRGSEALNWGYTCFRGSNVNPGILHDFASRIQQHAGQLGMRMNQPFGFDPLEHPSDLRHPRLRSQVEKLDLLVSTATQACQIHRL